MNTSIDRKWVWLGGIVVLAVLLVLPFLVKNYRVFQFNLVIVYAIAVLGLNLLGDALRDRLDPHRAEVRG